MKPKIILDFHTYLKSERWKLIEEIVVRREKRKCRICRFDWRYKMIPLRAKHVRYERNGKSVLGCERPDDLICVCSLHNDAHPLEEREQRRCRILYLLSKWGLQIVKIPYHIYNYWSWKAKRFRIALVSLLREDSTPRGSVLHGTGSLYGRATPIRP